MLSCAYSAVTSTAVLVKNGVANSVTFWASPVALL